MVNGLHLAAAHAHPKRIPFCLSFTQSHSDGHGTAMQGAGLPMENNMAVRVLLKDTVCACVWEKQFGYTILSYSILYYIL